MREKGIGCDCHVVVSYAISNDISVTILCRDLREGAINLEKSMTVNEKAELLFPIRDYGNDLMKAWRHIEGWLICMGLDEACHAYVIDYILKCSEFSPSHPYSLRLDVHVEISDIFSYIPKQPRLHSREEVEVEEEDEDFARVHVNKKICSHKLQV